MLYTAQLNLHTESEKEARAAMINLAKSGVRNPQAAALVLLVRRYPDTLARLDEVAAR